MDRQRANRFTFGKFEMVCVWVCCCWFCLVNTLLEWNFMRFVVQRIVRKWDFVVHFTIMLPHNLMWKWQLYSHPSHQHIHRQCFASKISHYFIAIFVLRRTRRHHMSMFRCSLQREKNWNKMKESWRGQRDVDTLNCIKTFLAERFLFAVATEHGTTEQKNERKKLKEVEFAHASSICLWLRYSNRELEKEN